MLPRRVGAGVAPRLGKPTRFVIAYQNHRGFFLLGAGIVPILTALATSTLDHVAPDFVAACGTEELKEAEEATVFLRAVEEHEDVSLSGGDRVFLEALEAMLDTPEMRTTEEYPST